MQIDSIIKQKDFGGIMNKGKVIDIDINTIQSVQDTLRNETLDYMQTHKVEEPIIVIQAQGNNIVVDGNHRIIKALEEDKKTIKARVTKHTYYYF